MSENLTSKDSGSAASRAMPVATIRPARRISATWIIPLLALLLAGGLAYRAWSLRGLVITIQLNEGHGLHPGDEVRYRGIAVGQVRSVEVADDLTSVLVTAGLNAQADRIARPGSRFWVVRPQVGLEGIAGLETLLGPRYLAVEPGESVGASGPRSGGARQRHFIGLDQPPIVQSIEPGDLEIVVQSAQRGSLVAGAPVSYRKVRVGTVLSIGLTSDAGAVEARLHIQRPFVPLIRQRTRFWDAGGVRTNLGLHGVSVEVESLQAALSGGVALATPPPNEAGEIVRTGHRFTLAPRPEDEWLAWEPMAAIGSSYLPPGAALPQTLRATMSWKEGRFFTGQRTIRGWLLLMPQGLLGPADLLKAAAGAHADSQVLEVAGTIVPLTAAPAWEGNELALRPASIEGSAWPASQQRHAGEPEDCLVVADPAAAPLPLSAARFTPQGSVWLIDPAVSVEPSWHGACVLGRSDGRLIGVLLVNGESLRVTLLPAEEK